MTPESILAAVVVFLVTFAFDFVWVAYTRAMIAAAALTASALAAVIVLFSGTAAIGYVSNPWLLIPAMLGAFSGTFAAMKTTRHDQQSPPNSGSQA